MKRLAWAGSWIFWYLGDRAYRILCYYDARESWVSFWYPVYNTLMGWSSSLQERVKRKGAESWPWGMPGDH